MHALALAPDRDDEPREDHIVDGYVEAATSKALPGIDLAQLAGFLDRPTTSAAMRDYRDALRAAT